MTPLDYVSGFPVAVNRLKITSAVELQILVWTAVLKDGLRQSNSQLAELLYTDRRTIINSVNRLKEKGYINNAGTKFHRVLVASSEIVSLFNSENSEIVTPVNSERVSQNGERVSQNSEKCDTHNIRDKKEYIYILKNQNQWSLPKEKFSEYLETFKGIDVASELRKAAMWLLDNPGKRKTAAGMPRYLTGWLGRVKPSGGTPQRQEINFDDIPGPDTDKTLAAAGFSPEQIAEIKQQGFQVA